MIRNRRGWIGLPGARTAVRPLMLASLLAIGPRLPGTSAGVAVAADARADASGEARLMRFPDVSADKVVFTFAGDLWTVPRAGGDARRLTAHPGDEQLAKFSPDGRWIAFSGEYDGNTDVFVIPSEGGEPRRLTYHPGSDLVVDWTPDGKRVLFRSTRQSFSSRFTRLFTVALEGGMEEVLPLPMASLASYSPDGKQLAYNPLSFETRTWKRYRGGSTPAIGIYDFAKNSYEEIPRQNSSDMFPMWAGGSIWFWSDRDGVANIYRYDLATHAVAAATHAQEYDVKWPSLGDGAIVYEEGGRLNLLDLPSGQSQRIPIRIASDNLLARPELRNVSSFITATALSPSAKRVLVGARGEVFTVPVEHGSPRNLTASPGVHERSPAWSPDGKWIAYLGDKSGEAELYVRPQGGGDETRVTIDGGIYRYGLVWSPDSKKLLYWDKALRLWYVDLDRRTPVLIDTDEYSDLSGGAWSPDSKWVAYTKTTAGRTSALFVYSLEQRNAFAVTDGFYNDSSPVFAADGKVLYFLSRRFFHPSGDAFDNHFGYFDTDGVFALTLASDTPSPFAPRSDEEGQKAEDESAKGKDGAAAKGSGDDKGTKGGGKDGKSSGDAEAKAEVPAVRIDPDGIAERVVQAPIPPGNYSALDARKGKLFYLSAPAEALQMGNEDDHHADNALHVYDLKKREDKLVIDGIDRYSLDGEGAKLLYVAGSKLGVVDAAEGQSVGKGAVDLSGLTARVDPRQEWNQLFHEAWRFERDFFWDPAMYGMDWGKIGERYAQLLPFVAHRSDLNYLIGELVGELGTSHAYVSGGEMAQRKRVNVGLLGADLEPDQGYYRLAKIYRARNATPAVRAPLGEPGLKVKAGDYLIAVNGQPVRATENPYASFQGLADQTVTLSVNHTPSPKGAWDIVVMPVANEATLRYLDWVESNRQKVATATGGRCGYVHVPNTSTDGLIMFDQYLVAQLDKSALIIDERYNSGGMIPDFYTEKLQRKLLTLLAGREGKEQPWPPVAVFGPKVMLANESAGSGGDCFPWFFQREKIGPVVGTRTWGGLVGIARALPMMDGGSVTVPEFAFWTPDKGGEWIVENKGVEPDYPVTQRPDLMVSGHDPQLEKALELISQGLEQQPALPKRPAYPRRH